MPYWASFGLLNPDGGLCCYDFLLLFLGNLLEEDRMKRIWLTVLLVMLLGLPSYSAAEISAPAWAVPMNDNNPETLSMQWDPVPGDVVQ